jgi:hypothetical protein
MSRTIDPHDSIDFIYKNGAVYGIAKSNRVYADELRKTIKAELMVEALQMGMEAVNAQERYAYSHPRYKAHLLAIKEAYEEEERLRWQLIAAQERVGVWRSQEASNRAVDKATV